MVWACVSHKYILTYKTCWRWRGLQGQICHQGLCANGPLTNQPHFLNHNLWSAPSYNHLRMSKNQKRGEKSQKMQKEIQKLFSEELPKIRIVRGMGFLKRRKKQRKEVSDQPVELQDDICATLLARLKIFNSININSLTPSSVGPFRLLFCISGWRLFSWIILELNPLIGQDNLRGSTWHQDNLL